MIRIPQEKLQFRFARSSGPGGQNVNKTNTRVTALFDVAGYDGFSQMQKNRIFKRLATRINKDGVLRVICQKYRTQRRNRVVAVERLNELLTTALRLKTVRRKTKPPRWSSEKRLEQKKRRGILKRQRAAKNLDEDS